MKESNTALLKKNKESNSYEEPLCSGSSFFLHHYQKDFKKQNFLVDFYALQV